MHASALRGLHLSSQTFNTSSTTPSMDFGETASTSAVPSWWRPKAERAGAANADVFRVKWVVETGAFDQLGKAWLWTIDRWQPCLLLRRRGSEQWSFAFGIVDDSAVLVWPAIERTA